MEVNLDKKMLHLSGFRASTVYFLVTEVFRHREIVPYNEKSDVSIFFSVSFFSPPEKPGPHRPNNILWMPLLPSLKFEDPHWTRYFLLTLINLDEI